MFELVARQRTQGSTGRQIHGKLHVIYENGAMYHVFIAQFSGYDDSLMSYAWCVGWLVSLLEKHVTP